MNNREHDRNCPNSDRTTDIPGALGHIIFWPWAEGAFVDREVAGHGVTKRDMIAMLAQTMADLTEVVAREEDQ